MVVDSSALVAIVLEEEDADYFAQKLASADFILISAITIAEASMVLLSRGGQIKVEVLSALLDRVGAEIVPFDVVQAAAAVRAFDRFGKGRHPAKLNFGDCLTYALAQQTGHELLFKGNDFRETDVKIA